ncbi:MAG TPA: Ldh family oxidoreductase [Afifellaceae bacterium]|nr:Ldh family oxidoreductase [Afifellaceae bacterium]
MNETVATRRVAFADLAAFIARALAAAGLPKDHAETVAELMAEADLQGSDGHGVFRLPHYVRRIRAGGINLNPDIRVARERGATALVDGDNGMGHLVMKRAAEIAIDKAAAQGVGWVGAFNSNHAGPASLYALMPAKRGMIGLYLAVGNANHLPPWGGTAMLLSTNPIAIAVPADTSAPVMLDMATTVAAYGKVKTAAQRGEAMPEGWMIDREGKPLTDPKRADEGFLLPIGGPKGYGLSLMFGLLAGTLNGAAFGRGTVDFNADDVTPTNTGQAVMAIDIAAFGDPAGFKAEVERVRADIKASPTLPGFDEVRLPGERTARIREERARAGIPLHGQLDGALRKVADELGVAAL